MERWKIFLYGIEWDDGKGEYDVSDLPQNLEVTIDAEGVRDAIEGALHDVTDAYGSLVASTQQIMSQRIA